VPDAFSPQGQCCFTAGLVYSPPKDINPFANIEENIPCMTHLSVALQPVWEEFSIGRSHGGMRLPCDGESEQGSGQADNEIAAVNMDLD
jgi:hypothetical protein